MTKGKRKQTGTAYGHVPVSDHECKLAIYAWPMWYVFCPVCGVEL